MTSISTTHMSPRAMMDARISTATKAGSISTTDQTALETALDSIDSALGVGGTSSSSSTGSAKQTSRLEPSQMKDRIDDLIDQQVSAGTLTDDQAKELKDFFAQGPGEDVSGVEGSKGAGGPRRMGGPPPMGPPPGASSDDDDDDDDDTSTDSTDATSATTQLDSLIAFLEKMRESMASSGGYGTSASSSSASDSSSSGLLVDQFA